MQDLTFLAYKAGYERISIVGYFAKLKLTDSLETFSMMALQRTPVVADFGILKNSHFQSFRMRV